MVDEGYYPDKHAEWFDLEEGKWWCICSPELKYNIPSHFLEVYRDRAKAELKQFRRRKTK